MKYLIRKSYLNPVLHIYLNEIIQRLIARFHVQYYNNTISLNRTQNTSKQMSVEIQNTKGFEDEHGSRSHSNAAQI